MTISASGRLFHIKNSEKCYRYKAEAIQNHAPMNKGIYELVTFDENQVPTVVYIGAAFEKTIYDHLEGHFNGTLEPTTQSLLAKYPNLYFDFIAEMDAKTLDDAKDVFWWLVQKYKPVFNNLNNVAHSGRPGEIEVKELD